MMKKILLTLFTLFTFNANAQFLQVDWNGKGDVTQDAVTELYWLDLSLTKQLTYNQTIGALANELAPFRLPTEQEIVDMFGNLFPTLITIDSGFVDLGNETVNRELSLFYTLFGGESDFIYGVYKTELNDKRAIGTDLGLGWFQGFDYTNTYNHWDDNSVVGHGMFLVAENLTVNHVPIGNINVLLLI